MEAIAMIHDRAEMFTNATPAATIKEQLPRVFVPEVYKRRGWDHAPIVIEKFHLLFFSQGKVSFHRWILPQTRRDWWGRH
jgi:hypothetical protein